MRPVYDEGGVTLYHGKAEDVLPTLAVCSVDAIVTDPPYGVGFHYESGREAASTAETYWAWFGPLYAAMMPALRPGGLLAMWQSHRHMRHYWEWYGDDIRIYAACKNFVQMRKVPINLGWDPVVMRYTPGDRPLAPPASKASPRNIDFYVANTAGLMTDRTRLEIAHPCPRPLAAVCEIVRNFTLPAGTILDPFAGSGTTLVAARMEGRKAVGIELETKYIDISIRRLQQAAMPLEVTA